MTLNFSDETNDQMNIFTSNGFLKNYILVDSHEKAKIYRLNLFLGSKVYQNSDKIVSLIIILHSHSLFV